MKHCEAHFPTCNDGPCIIQIVSHACTIGFNNSRPRKREGERLDPAQPLPQRLSLHPSRRRYYQLNTKGSADKWEKLLGSFGIFAGSAINGAAQSMNMLIVGRSEYALSLYHTEMGTSESIYCLHQSILRYNLAGKLFHPLIMRLGAEVIFELFEMDCCEAVTRCKGLSCFDLIDYSEIIGQTVPLPD